MNRIIALLIATAWACSQNSPSPAPVDDRAAPPQVAGEPDPAAAPAKTPAAPPRPEPAKASATYDPGPGGDYCSNDGECSFDHTCFPRRCIDAQKAVEADCDKTLPAPGDCACVNSRCSLRPNEAHMRQLGFNQEQAPSCGIDADCIVDVAAATCRAGGESSVGPIQVEGPICTCDTAAKRCVFGWSGPVACESWRDCSFTREPRLRPVSSKDVPRRIKGKVRPCRDSSIDSVCTPEGVCRVMRWKC